MRLQRRQGGGGPRGQDGEATRRDEVGQGHWADGAHLGTGTAEHDYPAAASYLRLLAGPALVDVCTALLSQAETIHQHAKDILRAARLPLLGREDRAVSRDLAKVAAGTALSPILLIRGDLSTGRPLQIADGYHRVCASYHINEDSEIPCRLVSLPAIAV